MKHSTCLFLLLAVVPSAVAQQVPPSLSLEEALRIARIRNPSFRQAVHTFNGSGAAVRAAWAAFLPSVNGNFNTSGGRSRRTVGEDDFGRPTQRGDVLKFTTSQSSQSVQASLTVFDGLRTMNELQRARADARASEANVDQEAARLQAEVSVRYFDAVRANKLIEVQEQLLQSARQQLEATQRRFRVAGAQQVDVLGAQVAVAQRESRVEQARGESRKARLELQERLGIEEQFEVVLSDPLPEVFDPSALVADALVAMALRQNPEIAQFEARAVATRHQVSAARAGYWPRISAGASFSRSASAPSLGGALFDLSPPNQSLGFSISATIPIFDNFQTAQTVAQASVSHKNAEESLRERRLGVERQIRSALIDLENAYRQVQLAQRSVELSRQRVELAREQYQQGALDFIQMQNALEQAADSERQAVEAQFSFANALITLEQLVGRPVRP